MFRNEISVVGCFYQNSVNQFENPLSGKILNSKLFDLKIKLEKNLKQVYIKILDCVHFLISRQLLLPNLTIQNQIFFRSVCSTHCAMLPPSYQQSCFSVNQFTANLVKKSTKKVSSLHLQYFLSLAITQNGKKNQQLRTKDEFRLDNLVTWMYIQYSSLILSFYN